MRSDQIKKGVERAPNRSLLYALGYTEEELNRPLEDIYLMGYELQRNAFFTKNQTDDNTEEE